MAKTRRRCCPAVRGRREQPMRPERHCLRRSGVRHPARRYLAEWPPYAFTDADGKPDGIDIRLITMLAQRHGLRAEIEDIKFPTIVPGVRAAGMMLG